MFEIPIPPPVRTLRSRISVGLFAVSVTALVALALTPLIIDARAWDDSYLMPKWAWMRTWTLVGLAAFFGRGFVSRGVRVPLEPTFLMAAAFTLLHLVSVLWSASPSLALERTSHLAWAGAFWLLITHPLRRRKDLIRTSWALVGVAAATALWTLGQDVVRAWFPDRIALRPNLPDWRGYLGAGLGNTNHIGDLLAVAMPVTLVLLAEARRRHALVAAFAAAVIIPAGLTICWSVGSNMGLIGAAVVMLGLTLRREGLALFRRRRRWYALLAAWGVMLAILLTDQPLNPHRPSLLREAFGSGRWHEGGPTRLFIWAGAEQIIRENPWLGVGAGNFTYVFPGTVSPRAAADPDLAVWQGMWTNAAHNVFLQTWAEVGLPGLILFFAMVGFPFFRLLRGIRWCRRSEFLPRLALVGMLTTWIINAQMNFALQTPVGLMTLVWILACATTEYASRSDHARLPSLLAHLGPVSLRLHFRKIGAPFAVGLEFPTTAASSAVWAVTPLAFALAVSPVFRRPLDAQAHYREARQRALVTPADPRIEAHVRTALEIRPEETNCRSWYSDWLIGRGRPAEALEQLESVRLRLDSSELFEREARALALLGRHEEAAAAMEAYFRRVPRARK